MGMSSRFLPVLFVLVLLYLTAASWAGTDTCITCHTDEEQLKTLVKPPEIGGEGEG